MINNKSEYLYVLDALNGEIAKIVIKEEDKDLSPFELLEKYGFNSITVNFQFSCEDIKEITVC